MMLTLAARELLLEARHQDNKWEAGTPEREVFAVGEGLLTQGVTFDTIKEGPVTRVWPSAEPDLAYVVDRCYLCFDDHLFVTLDLLIGIEEGHR